MHPPATHSAADPNATTGGVPALTAAAPPTSGDRYRLGEEIARGGMGAVFRATDAALGREVAVKVLLDRFAPDSTTARRFWDEARITGQLQHPNIPAVYDVGILPDCRPFLAIKLIKGETLDDLLKRRPDPSADRGRWLGVFEKICEAVAYAHAHDVIHRDLKPPNVMVGAFGEVQVMDWGLAKVLTFSRPTQSGADPDPNATAPETAIVSQRDSDDLLTQAGSVLGTPAYMAPEQAIGAIDQLDRRTDVFGLGGILAVVLTGQPPFVNDTAESTRQMAARGRLDDCFARLDASGAEPELVALCKRCLAIEPRDRPADADGVAKAVAGLRAAAEQRARQAELDRVRAEGRAAEQRQRRQLQLRLGGLVVGVLLAGVAGTGVGLWRADQARQTAEASDRATGVALLAKTAEEQAKGQALDSLRLTTADLEVSRAKTVEALRVLTDEVVETKLEQRPEVTEAERRFLRQVLALWRSVADTRGDTEESRRLRAEGASRVGSTLHQLGQLEEAETAYHAALALQQKLAADSPVQLDYQRNLAAIRKNLGFVLRDTGRVEEAEAAYRAALGIYEKLVTNFPAKVDYRRELASIQRVLGNVLVDARRGRVADAVTAFRAAIAVQEKLATDFPTRPDYRQELAATQDSLGRLLRAAGRAADAEVAYRAALGIYEKLTTDFPARPDYQQDAARTQSSLGNLLSDAGRMTESEAAHQAALSTYERLTADFPARPSYRIELGWAYCNRGNLIRDTGKPADSLSWYDKAIAAIAPFHAADPRQVFPKQILRDSHWGRAVALDRLGRHVEALVDWPTAIDLSVPPVRHSLKVRQAISLLNAGQIDRAVAEMDILIAEVRTRPTGTRWYDFACLFAVASDKFPAQRDKYAGRAMDILLKAVRSEFVNASHLWRDADLDPLRSRPDFQKLLADLGAAREPAPKPRPTR